MRKKLNLEHYGTGMAQLLARITRLIVGEREPGAIADYQRQAFALAIVLTFATVGAFAAVFHWLGDPHSSVVLLAALLPTTAAVVVLRRGLGLSLALQVLALTLFVLVTYLSYREGGLAAPALPWLVLIPFILIVAGAYRSAFIWLTLDIAAVGVMWYLDRNGFAFPRVLGTDPPVLYTLGMIGFFVVTISWLVVVDQERRRSQRRLQILNQELTTARDAALAAAAAKSRFLANMSHELRTPMNGVLGMAELLADSGLNAQQRRYAETIHSSGQALLGVITDVLDFSSIETGNMQLELVEFDLPDLVRQVAEMFAHAAHAKGLQLRYSVDERVPRLVRGDRSRLRQVLMNLLGNGIKFTERGEVVIEVAINQTAGAGAPGVAVGLEFVVRDSGIGMSMMVREKIFDAFAQADNSTTRRFGGTGLGLSIVRGLLHLMGGQVSVESEPGRGSTFRVTVNLEAISPSNNLPLRDSLSPVSFAK